MSDRPNQNPRINSGSINLLAFKVVYMPLSGLEGVYFSAVERSTINIVTYSCGKESFPNIGANAFICVFDTLEHARSFHRVVFNNLKLPPFHESAILSVLAKDVTSSCK